MALSIKTEAADRLAREQARLRGDSITQAVTVALREQRPRERSRPKTPEEVIQPG
jgi:antitoxin VapB